MSKHEKHHSANEHKAEGSKTESKKILGFELNMILLLAVLLIATALVSTWAGFSVAQSAIDAAAAKNAVSAVNTAALSKEVETYINANLLPAGTTAKITGIKEVTAGFYELPYTITQSGTVVSSGNLYANKSKLFLVQGEPLDLKTPLPKPEVQEEEPAATAPVKSDKPKIQLYVMSFCPYGNKAEDTMKPVFELLKNNIDFNVHYIVNVSGTTVSSLHGAPEVVQNEREACVLKYYGNQAWFDFAGYVNTNCGSNGSCWEAGATTLKLDKDKISTCVTNEGLDLMKANEAASNAANAKGSPTMFINGVKTNSVYQYGNSEAYKKAICDSFNNAPSACSTVLSGTTATAQGGSC
jgi:hypothetical protein